MPIDRTATFDHKCAIKTDGVVVVAAARVNQRPTQWQGVTENEGISGWAMVGSIRDDARNQELTLFRREFKANDKFEYKTSNWTNPFLVVLKEKHVAPVLEQAALKTKRKEILHLRPPSKPAGLGQKSARDVVMLTAPEVAPGTLGTSILQREVVRQAFLIAAREELGLATRDASLRETFPQEAEPDFFPFDILVVNLDTRQLRVVVFRQKGSDYEALLTHTLQLAPEGAFEDLVAKSEALSRREFAQLLKGAGLDKIDPTAPATEESPTDAQPIGDEFNIISQFASLRRLHAAVKAQGESARSLSALACVYANLGAESAFLWSPAHKVFEARGLLYAERLVQQTSGSPQALWTRAYVRALVGRHQGALADLAAVEAASVAGVAIPKLPDWFYLIRAHCEFDRSGLQAAEKEDGIRPLARYLQMLEQEFAAGYQARVRTAERVLEVLPESFRALDLLGGSTPLGMRRLARYGALDLFAGSLYSRLGAVPDLPAAAQKICRD